MKGEPIRGRKKGLNHQTELTISPNTVLALALLVLVAIVAGADDLDHTNGQPGCRTQAELNQRFYRNNWDPTSYWVCDTLNERARAVRCEVVEGRPQGYMDGVGCVEWQYWAWYSPVAPPSRP